MKFHNKYRKENQKRHFKPAFIEYGFEIPILFDDYIVRDNHTPNFESTGVSTPSVNIIETNDDFKLEMVAPGMKKDAFNISIQNNILTVTYDHADNREAERKDWKYIVHEYNYHSFSRSFSLPSTIEIDKIEARYDQGILQLTIPKKQEARKKPARQISVA